jgi:hypothetical protein
MSDRVPGRAIISPQCIQEEAYKLPRRMPRFCRLKVITVQARGNSFLNSLFLEGASMTKVITAALLSLCAWKVQALEIDHCPLPQYLKNTQGIYTAPTVSRKGQWIGASSAVRSIKDDRFSAEAATSFQGAVFYTSVGNGTARGVLSRCMYLSESGESLDLYYRPEVRPGLAVKLLDLKHWKLQAESSTGLDTYICRNKQQGGCVFAVVE